LILLSREKNIVPNLPSRTTRCPPSHRPFGCNCIVRVSRLQIFTTPILHFTFYLPKCCVVYLATLSSHYSSIQLHIPIMNAHFLPISLTTSHLSSCIFLNSEASVRICTPNILIYLSKCHPIATPPSSSAYHNQPAYPAPNSRTQIPEIDCCNSKPDITITLPPLHRHSDAFLESEVHQLEPRDKACRSSLAISSLKHSCERQFERL
jgi:hypothetical protein